MADLTSRLILTLVDRVTAPARAVQSSINRVQNQIDRNNAAIRATQGQIFGLVAASAAAAAALSAPVRAAMAFESALADVRKVVDFTPEQFGAFREELFGLAREIPVTVQDLTEIAAAAGQAGIAAEDIIRVTEAAAKIGVAFDIPAGEAGDALAKLMTGLGLTVDEAVLLTDAMNHLSNSQASSASEILDVVRRVGAQGRQFGFDAEEVAAFASAMIAAGAESEVAATSFNNMGRALTMGASAPTRLQEGLQGIGLEATDVARRMQEDAVGTTLDVLERISALPAELRAAAANDIFGAEARALGPLMTNLDLLRETLGLVADESKYAGSSFKEFENRSKTFEADMLRFRNVMSELSITLGEALIPVLADTMQRMLPVIDAMIAWSKENGPLIGTLARVTGSLVGLRFAFLGLKLIGLTGRGGYLWLMAMGLRTVGTAGAALGRAVQQSWALQSALAAMSGARVNVLDRTAAALRAIAGVTGLGAVVSAIKVLSVPVAIVATAGLLIYKYWDAVSATFQGVWRAVSEFMAPAMERLEELLTPIQPVVDAVKAAFDGLKEGISATFQFVADFFSGGLFGRNILTEEEKARISQSAHEITTTILNALSELPTKLYDAGVEAVRSLWDGMKHEFEMMLAWVRGIPGEIAAAMGLQGDRIPATDPSQTLSRQATDYPYNPMSPEFRSGIMVPGGGRLPSDLQEIRDRADEARGSSETLGASLAEVATMEVRPQIDTANIDRAVRMAHALRSVLAGINRDDLGRAISDPVPIGGRASGGPVGRGLYLVGEEGPELLNVGASGYVFDALRTRSLLSPPELPALPVARPPASAPHRTAAAAQRPVAVTFGDIVIQGGANASAEDVARQIGREVENAMRSSFGDLM